MSEILHFESVEEGLQKLADLISTQDKQITEIFDGQVALQQALAFLASQLHQQGVLDYGGLRTSLAEWIDASNSKIVGSQEDIGKRFEMIIREMSKIFPAPPGPKGLPSLTAISRGDGS